MSESRATYDAGPNQRLRRANGRRPPAAAEAGFPGCTAVPMDADQLARMEGQRIEYWDSADGLAWMVREGVSIVHELPAQRLAALLDRIAEARGAAIVCCGSTTYYERGAAGEHIRAMEADQTAYLDAARSETLPVPPVVLGDDAPPDLVLEVDHTTDVRRRKLGEYERWRFPEVWVEVPDARHGIRSRRRSGLTIHVLDAKSGRYEETAASRALPGWTAEEIHRALNEPTRSAATQLAIERVGRALGERDGAEPTDRHDDPTRSSSMRHVPAAHAVGEAEAKAAMVRQILAQRGIACSPDAFADATTIGSLAPAQLVAAALACRSEAEFLAAVTGESTP